jgi:hypothetical protein
MQAEPKEIRKGMQQLTWRSRRNWWSPIERLWATGWHQCASSVDEFTAHFWRAEPRKLNMCESASELKKVNGRQLFQEMGYRTIRHCHWEDPLLRGVPCKFTAHSLHGDSVLWIPLDIQSAVVVPSAVIFPMVHKNDMFRGASQEDELALYSSREDDQTTEADT